MKIIIGHEGQVGRQTITIPRPDRVLMTTPVKIVLEHEDEHMEIEDRRK